LLIFSVLHRMNCLNGGSFQSSLRIRVLHVHLSCHLPRLDWNVKFLEKQFDEPLLSIGVLLELLANKSFVIFHVICLQKSDPDLFLLGGIRRIDFHLQLDSRHLQLNEAV
jgi:hypothetical protein